MDTTLLQSIHQLDQEIGSTKAELKTVKEALASELEQTNVHKQLQEAIDKVSQLKQQLKGEIQGSSDITKLMDEQAELQYKLKDQKEILSHHLLQYNRQEDETQLPLANQKRARQILISARLSAKEESYQERMKFDSTREYSISDNKTKTTISKAGIQTKPIKGGKK